MIKQYDFDGNYLSSFEDIEEASEFTGVSKRKIRRCLSGETQKAGGFIWEHSQSCATKEELTKIINKSSTLKEVINPVKKIEPFKNGNPNNVLVIGDIHEPFSRKGYLEHCRKVQEQFNCGTVVFIGDVIDNHYSSFHDTDPDGVSAGDELDHAISKIQEWYYTFPKAYVCIGNHDAIITRKAFSAGVSNRWIKSYSEVLDTPDWQFDMTFDIKDVHYYHGTGSSGDKAALNRAMNLRQSVVQGHIHTTASIQYNASNRDLIWGMQVGCGIDDSKYAFAYAQSNIKKSIISCGVVIDGKLPIVIPMEL